MTETISEKEAKQGRKGLPILTVLIVSVVLALAVWFAVEWAFTGPENSMSENKLPAVETTEGATTTN